MGERINHRILRKMKIISDQAGIMNRYLREQDYWKPHLENTRNYISAFVEKNNYRSVSILGSGWLLDVPTDFLKDHTDITILIDVFHPPQIKHKLKNFSNFQLVDADITGGLILSVFNAYRNKKTRKMNFSFKDLEIKGFSPPVETDCYISLNILNQLDILIIDFLKQHKIGSSEEHAYLRTTIQQSHIKSLPTGKSCLITDYEELVTEKDGKAIENKSLIFTTLPNGQNNQKWQWKFDLTGSYNIGYNTTFNVIAMEL